MADSSDSMHAEVEQPEAPRKEIEPATDEQQAHLLASEQADDAALRAGILAGKVLAESPYILAHMEHILARVATLEALQQQATTNSVPSAASLNVLPPLQTFCGKADTQVGSLRGPFFDSHAGRTHPPGLSGS